MSNFAKKKNLPKNFDIIRRRLGGTIEFLQCQYKCEPDDIPTMMHHTRDDLAFERTGSIIQRIRILGHHECEIARYIAEHQDNSDEILSRLDEDVLVYKYGCEYWSGWILAMCLMYYDVTIGEFTQQISLEELQQRYYPPYHQMNEELACERLFAEYLRRIQNKKEQS